MSENDAAASPGGKLTLAVVERFLMAASMGVLRLLTMANVLVRYFTDISFAFTEEISVALLVVMTLIGASHAFATNHHIAITFFVDRNPALLGLARRFAAFCSLLMFGLLAWYGVAWRWLGTITTSRSPRRRWECRSGGTPSGCRCFPSSS